MDIEKLAVHQVGNPSRDEELILSENLMQLEEEVIESLTVYFSKPFSTDDYFNLSHVNDLESNEVYRYVSEIFDQPESLHTNSVKLAKQLFAVSDHPKVKSGEFYVVYFTNCPFEGDSVDAVGLLKSENKDRFLEVNRRAGQFEIETKKGININKLDKGCIIYNLERENGYIVSVVDQTNKQTEARYWMDDFLMVRERQDEFHSNKNAMELCQNFIKTDLNREFEISKAEEAELLENSVKFFRERSNFNMDEYSREVIAQPEVIEEFKQFKDRYAEDRGVQFEDDFDISPRAVKKSTKNFKSVIKLDKNFHIYVHGNPRLISREEDENGKYYKVYFKEEH